LNFVVIPAKAGLLRQDAVANIGAADGPKGEPQDAARSASAMDGASITG
jgi:hypothetical protein